MRQHESHAMITTLCQSCKVPILEGEPSILQTGEDTVQEFCTWDCLDYQRQEERDRKTA